MDNQETLQFDYSNNSPLKSESLAPGMFLGKEKNYRLEKFLGAGGMGNAWLATEIEDGVELRKVVCKVLPALLQHEQTGLKNTLKIFHLVQPLSHPNICPIYALKVDPVYGYFFVMGYADGGTLEDWVHEQPDYAKGLPVSRLLEVLRPIAQALDYAHEMGIMHRDVKPQNILFVTRCGNRIPWLIDFGISAQIHSTMTQTLGNRGSSGTPAYMAPEQCQNMAQDGRTDQYALGVLAYQFLSGHLPFTAATPVSLWKEIVYNPVPPLMNVSAPVNSVIQRALAKERKDRFASCTKFLDALEAADREGTKFSFVPSVMRYVNLVIGVLKKRKWLWLACLLALLAIGGFIFSIFAKRPQTKPAETAPPVVTSEPSTKPKPEDEKKVLAAGDRKVLTVDGVEYAFRWCPPGEFMMGGTLYENEQPIHKVKLTQGFWLLETEVTQKMWKSVMGSNPSHFEGDQNPVDQVSWNNCQEFCQKLSEKLGKKVQLPTEAQWEYACRAGTTGDFAGDLNEMAWYGNNSKEKTHPVGLKKPNAWGLYDMHGNLCEHCLDWFGDYSDLPENDPEGPSSGIRHVIRGGSWDAWSTYYCRSQHRWGDTPDYTINSRGLRILLVPDAAEVADAAALPVKSDEPSAQPKSDDVKDLAAGDRKVLTVDGIEYAFRWCPPGEFMMGGDKNFSETPIHNVKLTKGFWLLETEVTQAMWQSVMGESIETKANQGIEAHTLHGVGDTYPIYYVSWDDCQDFCKKLGQKLGQTIKLPTEAQWEYACRAGTTEDSDIDSMGWHEGNADSTIHEVGQKKPNPWGLYDMLGNLWEWCSDCLDSSYYSRSPTNDPENTSSNSFRVFRGGCCFGSAEDCRPAVRHGGSPIPRWRSLGVRVLMVPEDETESDGTTPSVASDEQSAKPGSQLEENHIPPGTRKVLSAAGVDFAFRWCPPGEFMMGGKAPNGGTEPVHKVNLTQGFWLLETEITQAQWKAVMGMTLEEQAQKMLLDDKEYYFDLGIGSKTIRERYGLSQNTKPSETLYGEGPTCAMYHINWNESVEFCQKLSALLKQEIQLPTEAQWEYACRAGEKPANTPSLDSIAWYNGNSFGQIHSVGLKKPNAWGLYDMIGNVWEWCSDWYDAGYYIVSPKNDPTGPARGSTRAFRGGSWYNVPWCCCPEVRFSYSPEYRYSDIGLRIVLIPKKEETAPKKNASKPTTSRDSFEWDGTKITKFIGKETEVVLPNGTTEIGERAFKGCSSLTSVVIPEGVTTIAVDAFNGCLSLTSVTIPDSAKTIGHSAFVQCPALKPWIISSAHPYFKSDGTALLTKDGKKIVACLSSAKEYQIPKGVTKIGNSAFNHCHSLTSVVIPEGVTEIEESAFYYCESLQSIVIPDSITKIGFWAFEGCKSLTSVVISKNIKSIGPGFFNSCNSLKSVVIPSGVKSIGWSAFSGCTSLTSIVIPDSVTEIDLSAFQFCPNLTIYALKGSKAEEYAKSNNIPVKDLKEWKPEQKPENEKTPQDTTSKPTPTSRDSFEWDGTKIKRFIGKETEVVIPDGTTEIGDFAFRERSSLTSVVIPESVKEIGDDAFIKCSFLTSVVIPKGMTKIGCWAFSSCSSLTSVEIPDSVKEIGGGAFEGCTALKEWPISSTHPYFKRDGVSLLTKDGKKLVACLPSAVEYRFPEGVTEIGFGAFAGCSALTSLVIPEGVTEIRGWTFSDCRSLTSVVIPEGVSLIRYGMFDNCSSLTSVVIPESVTEIEGYAFNGCSSLTSVMIPDGVKEFSGSAFAGCTALKEWSISSTNPYFKTDGVGLLTKDGKKLVACLPSATEYRIPEGVTEIGNEAFRDCHSLTSVVIPEGVTEIGYSEFYGCSSLKSVVFPKGVTKIGDSTFFRCSSLTSVVIPEGIKEIKDDMFYCCSSLTSVVIPKGVTVIERSAFGGCSSLTSVVIPEGVTEIGDIVFYDCRKLTIYAPAGSKAEEYAKENKIPFKDLKEWKPEQKPEEEKNTQDTTSKPTSTSRESFEWDGTKITKFIGNETDVVIPEGVTWIGDESFGGCSSLTSVVIPESVTMIGEYAFMDCKSLTSLIIPDGVTTIQRSAFERCSSLTSVVLPESTTEISDSAFSGCPNLTIHAPTGSKAEEYAKQKNITFEAK